MDLAGLYQLLDHHYPDCNPLDIMKATDVEAIGVNTTSWTAASSLLALGPDLMQRLEI